MSKDEASLDSRRASKLSTANVALGIALIPLLLMYRSKVDPVGDFLWLFSQPHNDIAAYFWQGRLADLLSIGLLTSLVYVGLRRSGIDRRLQPSEIVHGLILAGFSLPLLLAAVSLWWAVKQNAVAEIYGVLLYGNGGLFGLMLAFEIMAMALLVLAHWVDIRLVVKKRQALPAGIDLSSDAAVCRNHERQ